jgi:hypothetical protein
LLFAESIYIQTPPNARRLPNAPNRAMHEGQSDMRKQKNSNLVKEDNLKVLTNFNVYHDWVGLGCWPFQ